MEQIILEIITKSAEEKVIRSPQHNFTKGKSCSTDLIALVMAGQDDEGRAVAAVYLDFSKAFVTVP